MRGSSSLPKDAMVSTEYSWPGVIGFDCSLKDWSGGFEIGLDRCREMSEVG